MKQICILLMVTICATMFTACSNETDDKSDPFNPDVEEPTDEPNVDTTKYWIITMTSKISNLSDNNNQCFIFFDRQTIVDSIDWGVGHGFTPAQKFGYSDSYLYAYGTQGQYTIKIKGHGVVKKFNCDSGRKQVTFLDASQCAETLEEIVCSRQLLTSLDVTKYKHLKILNCYNNKITTLDVSKCTELIELKCSENQLPSLDVGKCITLTTLNCGYNQFISLDVNQNTELTLLHCGGNQLTSLDISKCKALTNLDCRSNQLSTADLNQIYNDLPTVDDGNLVVSKNPGTKSSDESIARNKGWYVQTY